MVGRPCGACGAVCTDRFVCPDCLDELRDRLWSVRGLAEDLDITLTRQANVAPDEAGVRAASAEQPLSFHWGASEALYGLDRTLLAWALTLSAAHRHPVALPTAVTRTINPRDPAHIPATRSRAAATAGWLAERVDQLAHHQDGAQAVEEITAAIRSGFAVIDRPPERRFAGQCSAEVVDENGETVLCEADVFARPNAETVECRLCGTVHSVDERRAYLLDASRTVLLTATDASRALPGLLGRTFTAATVRGMAHRGVLEQHPPAYPNGPARYLLGDVIDALVADEADAAIQKNGTRRRSVAADQRERVA